MNVSLGNTSGQRPTAIENEEVHSTNLHTAPSTTTACPSTLRSETEDSSSISPTSEQCDSTDGSRSSCRLCTTPFSKPWQNIVAFIAATTALLTIYYAFQTYRISAWTAKKDYYEYCGLVEVGYTTDTRPPANIIIGKEYLYSLQYRVSTNTQI